MIFSGLMNSLQGRTDENTGDYILLLVVGSFCESVRFPHLYDGGG